MLADKAYDADGTGDRIAAQGAAANIPDRRNRIRPHGFSPTLCRKRNRAERFFNKLEHHRRIATRHEKLAANSLAMIELAATRIWLRGDESTS